MPKPVETEGSTQDDRARPVAEADRGVGAQIRSVRLVRQLSLKALANLAGISVGLLSQIERGQSSASVKTLQSLAHVLGFELGDFFVPISGDVSPPSAVVTRRDQRRCDELGPDEATSEWLTPPADGERLGLHLLHLPPDASFAVVESGFVMVGGVELVLSEQAYLLGLHDTFSFPGNHPFRVGNAGGRTATILWARFETSAPPSPLPTEDPETAIQ